MRWVSYGVVCAVLYLTVSGHVRSGQAEEIKQELIAADAEIRQQVQQQL